VVDAILIVGAETVRRDNPRLTVRKGSRHTQPWRVILTKSEPASAECYDLSRFGKERTVVYRNRSLRAVLRARSARDTSVLISGVSDILSQALDQRLIDKVQIYIAPILTGAEACWRLAEKIAASTQQSPWIRRATG